jgi:hypothetical protein
VSSTSFFSPTPVTGTQSRSESERLQPTEGRTGQDDLCQTDSTQQEHIENCYRDMLMARMEYRIHSDFLAAADYTNARAAWERAVDAYVGENS